MDFIYKLVLIDRLFSEENWTEEDEKIVDEHFKHLQTLLKENKLLLAGKTSGLSDDTYGIVIFRAESMNEAKEIMSNDPAIQKGIMNGYLQQYDLALYNNQYKK